MYSHHGHAVFLRLFSRFDMRRIRALCIPSGTDLALSASRLGMLFPAIFRRPAGPGSFAHEDTVLYRNGNQVCPEDGICCNRQTDTPAVCYYASADLAGLLSHFQSFECFEALLRTYEHVKNGYVDG